MYAPKLLALRTVVPLGCEPVADPLSASDAKCHHACPVENCSGRCDKAQRHGGDHECNVNASHTWS